MKTIILVEKEINIISVGCCIPIYRDEMIDDAGRSLPEFLILDDCAGEDHVLVEFEISIDTGTIMGWHQGTSYHLYSCVKDAGSYYLYDEHGEVMYKKIKSYAPSSLIPGDFGDHIDLDIDENGKIKNWAKKISFCEFFDVKD